MNNALKRLDDAFSGTPAGFHLRVEKQLRSLGAAQTKKRRVRLLPLVAALLLLLAATAFAASRLGALYFLTERLAAPLPAQQVIDHTITPLSQKCEGGMMEADVRDGVLLNNMLSFCVHFAPKDSAYALICEGDIGTDGEHADWVWADGKIYESLAEWAPTGKTPLVVGLPLVRLGGYALMRSWDWVPEGNGVTFFVEVDVSDMPVIHETDLKSLAGESGLIEITVTADGMIDNEGERYTTVLTSTIPIEKGEGK